MYQYKNTHNKTIWILISDIACHVPEDMGWIRKSSTYKPLNKINKQYKDVYKLLQLANYLEGLICDVMGCICKHIIDKECNACLSESSFEALVISKSFMRRMCYVQAAQSINKLKIHDYHKWLHRDAEWSKTTLVNEFVQYIIKSVCYNYTCPDHESDNNIINILEATLRNNFTAIIQDLVLLAIRSNYRCDVSIQYDNTPFEQGPNAICRILKYIEDMQSSAEDMLVSGTFTINNDTHMWMDCFNDRT